MKLTKAHLKRLISEIVLTEKRMETDVFRIVARALDTRGPLSHQQLLATVLNDYPNVDDEEIDSYIDSFETSGDIKFDTRSQKYT